MKISDVNISAGPSRPVEATPNDEEKAAVEIAREMMKCTTVDSRVFNRVWIRRVASALISLSEGSVAVAAPPADTAAKALLAQMGSYICHDGSCGHISCDTLRIQIERFVQPPADTRESSEPLPTTPGRPAEPVRKWRVLRDDGIDFLCRDEQQARQTHFFRQFYKVQYSDDGGITWKDAGTSAAEGTK